MATPEDRETDTMIALLRDAETGDQEALNKLVHAVYPELKRLAQYQLGKERSDHTLSATAIVHEAYERLSTQDGPWNDKAHFMRTAARIMRHLLVDYARRRNADKRGAGVNPVTLEAEQVQAPADQLAILRLEEALEQIADSDPRLERIVECRMFAGLTVAETAEALDLSVRTVERDWQKARDFIHQALGSAREGN